ncbi:MAG: hypothetical protein QM479_00570 [Pseudomonadota bacterium]
MAMYEGLIRGLSNSILHSPEKLFEAGLSPKDIVIEITESLLRKYWAIILSSCFS